MKGKYLHARSQLSESLEILRLIRNIATVVIATDVALTLNFIAEKLKTDLQSYKRDEKWRFGGTMLGDVF